MINPNQNWYSRTELLIGEKNVEKLRNSHVLVVGLGGVGSHAVESLVRTGIGNLTIVDGDKIQPSNINRQLPATSLTVGLHKTEVLKTRMLEINPGLNISVITEYLRDERMIEVLKMHPYDFVVDAIDTLSPKIYLIYHTMQAGIPLVSSMGAGGRLNPENIKVSDISESYNCRLASVLRKRLHHLGIYKGFTAVFSDEFPAKHSVLENNNEPNKKSTVGVISYMPAIFGYTCASVVIRGLMNKTGD